MARNKKKNELLAVLGLDGGDHLAYAVLDLAQGDEREAVASYHLRSGALFKRILPIGGDSSCVEHRAGKHMFHGGRMARRTKTHVNDSGDIWFLRRHFHGIEFSTGTVPIAS